MIISSETDYAIRILYALSDGNQHTAGDISEQELVPKQFSYKILKKLTKADMVDVIRGTDGGYVLKGNLKTITLYNLVQVIETDIILATCLRDGHKCARRMMNEGMCITHNQLMEIQDILDNELKSRSIYQILFGA